MLKVIPTSVKESLEAWLNNKDSQATDQREWFTYIQYFVAATISHLFSCGKTWP